MLTTDELFLRTCEELREIVGSHDEYRVTRGAALVRQLFFDQRCLVDIVNKSRKVPITFGPFDTPFGIQPALSRTEYFSDVQAYVQGVEYTRKDMILGVACIDGGVHVGSPEEREKDPSIVMGMTFQIGALPAQSEAVRRILGTLSKALEPLEAALRASKQS
jgi:hypothetical protein